MFGRFHHLRSVFYFSRGYFNRSLTPPLKDNNYRNHQRNLQKFYVTTMGFATVLCLENDRRNMKEKPLPRRLQRFSNFASVEYNGVVYMTPQDLLDSLVLDVPRERVFRNVLDKRDVDRMLRNTPQLKKSNKDLFRKLGYNGIISYAEYLFLLTLLTKSHSNFKIAFSIFDDDGNELIDKQEFLHVRTLVVEDSTPKQSESAKNMVKTFIGLDSAALPISDDVCDITTHNHQRRLEELLSTKRLPIRDQIVRPDSATEMDITDCLQQDTTILLHLFGHRGDRKLSFDEFQTFYNNLQRELIEIEFYEFARGKTEIAAVDFAKLVLRYSLVSNSKYDEFLQRVVNRVSFRDQGISLDQFEQFSRFLNNLEDFTGAVRLYAAAEIPVSRTEFRRAVKCSTGLDLDGRLVDIVFKIFDADNDGHLSYNEFIEVMNDRLSRGFKNRIRGAEENRWNLFRKCVVKELKVHGGQHYK